MTDNLVVLIFVPLIVVLMGMFFLWLSGRKG